MADVTYVTPERYAELAALIGRRRALSEKLHKYMKKATLADKLTVQREITEISAELAK